MHLTLSGSLRRASSPPAARKGACQVKAQGSVPISAAHSPSDLGHVIVKVVKYLKRGSEGNSQSTEAPASQREWQGESDGRCILGPLNTCEHLSLDIFEPQTGSNNPPFLCLSCLSLQDGDSPSLGMFTASGTPGLTVLQPCVTHTAQITRENSSFPSFSVNLNLKPHTRMGRCVRANFTVSPVQI